jgi:hypothetical protein
VTRQQLRIEVGIGESTIDRLVAHGRLDPLRRGIYGLAGCPPDLRTALSWRA